MIRPRQTRPRPSSPPSSPSQGVSEAPVASDTTMRTRNAAVLHFAALLFLIIQASWIVYRFQYLRLPRPLAASETGGRGFSEERAYKHVQELTKLGPHPVGSDALDDAVQYVLSKAQEVQGQAPWDVDVEVDFFHARSGANCLQGGLFKGKTLAYANLKHVVVRVKPKFLSGADGNAVLVSSHIDTVVTTEGAGDCSSCVAVMLELVRAISHWAHGFKHAVIFLFNTGEEEGLDGAHSFITQHPWNSSIRTVINLEALGIGGKSILFQGGPEKWIVELYAKVVKYPSAQILAQDLFLSGIVKSATDFQVYQELLSISGLDFAYSKNGAVYHTRNDKIELLTPGSLQHSGENTLALLREIAVSFELPIASMKNTSQETLEWKMVYFDILGKYIVAFPQQFAKQLHITIIAQSLLLLLMSVVQGGLVSLNALGLIFLTLVLTWSFSIGSAAIVGIALPCLSTAAVPYTAHPWLALGLFGAPALFGALFGHSLGHRSLKILLLRDKDLRARSSKQALTQRDLDLVNCDAERWLFKAGFVQWVGFLALGTWLGVGSSYLALIWLVFPAIAYGLIDATLSPRRIPQELKSITLFLGLTIPLIVSAGPIISIYDSLLSSAVRFDRNPGSVPDWLWNIIVAVITAAIVTMFLIYILPLAHRSGGTVWILTGTIVIFITSLLLAMLGIVPPFTKYVAKGVNVIQVVEVDTLVQDRPPVSSYVSFTSLTPGRLTRELNFLKTEGFTCGVAEGPDFVTHVVKYGCTSSVDIEEELEGDWNNLPSLKRAGEKRIGDERVTTVFIDTASAHRWVLAINAEKIVDFQLETSPRRPDWRQILVPRRPAIAVDGWHLIQFITDKNGPHTFELSLYWSNMSSHSEGRSKEEKRLLKLRTDVNKVTEKVAATLKKLPEWVTSFGKSTSPYPLSYLINLPIDFETQSL